MDAHMAKEHDQKCNVCKEVRKKTLKMEQIWPKVESKKFLDGEIKSIRICVTPVNITSCNSDRGDCDRQL